MLNLTNSFPLFAVTTLFACVNVTVSLCVLTWLINGSLSMILVRTLEWFLILKQLSEQSEAAETVGSTASLRGRALKGYSTNYKHYSVFTM